MAAESSSSKAGTTEKRSARPKTSGRACQRCTAKKRRVIFALLRITYPELTRSVIMRYLAASSVCGPSSAASTLRRLSDGRSAQNPADDSGPIAGYSRATEIRLQEVENALYYVLGLSGVADALRTAGDSSIPSAPTEFLDSTERAKWYSDFHVGTMTDLLDFRERCDALADAREEVNVQAEITDNSYYPPPPFHDGPPPSSGLDNPSQPTHGRAPRPGAVWTSINQPLDLAESNPDDALGTLAYAAYSMPNHPTGSGGSWQGSGLWPNSDPFSSTLDPALQHPPLALAAQQAPADNSPVRPSPSNGGSVLPAKKQSNTKKRAAADIFW